MAIGASYLVQLGVNRYELMPEHVAVAAQIEQSIQKIESCEKLTYCCFGLGLRLACANVFSCIAYTIGAASCLNQIDENISAVNDAINTFNSFYSDHPPVPPQFWNQYETIQLRPFSTY